MKNYFEDGIKYGENISKCTNDLIVSLIAERARMYEELIGKEESNLFIKGAASAITKSFDLQEEVNEKNKQLKK